MLDHDLAELYGVLTNQEVRNLRFQFGTSSLISHGGSRYLPCAFTEHGVAMLAGVLKSPEAIQVNIEIIRTFIRLRQVLNSHRDLEQKLNSLEQKYDSQFKAVFDAIRRLMQQPDPSPKRRIGF